jgi:hypothetical protein
VLKPFRDLKEGVKREKVGEVFEVSPERFKEINSTKHGKLVEKVKEPKKDKK